MKLAFSEDHVYKTKHLQVEKNTKLKKYIYVCMYVFFEGKKYTDLLLK